MLPFGELILGINPVKGLKFELYADYYDVKPEEHWDT